MANDSTKRFVIADTHFFHDRIITFPSAIDPDKPLRPFKTMTEMHYVMAEKWNNVVGPKDIVYVLGDVVYGKKNLWFLAHLNGDKVLIRGNHDILSAEEYLHYFRDIRGVYNLPFMERKLVLTHAPLHPISMDRWELNIHGHLHDVPLNDPKYYCASVECIDYTPKLISEILEERNLI